MLWLSQLYHIFQIPGIIGALEEMRNVDSPHLGGFQQQLQDGNLFHGITLEVAPTRGQQTNQRDKFAQDQDAVLVQIVENIKGRLPQMDLLDSMQVNATHNHSLNLVTK